jgi:hypothetical protein
MADSSFYGDTPNYATSYPTQNDGNSNPNGDKPAPSSFYPNGGGYVPLAVSDDVLAEMDADLAAAQAAQAAAAASAAAAAASLAAMTPATATPLMDGTAAVGVATKYAREDHIHPTDTSRAPVASPTFTGAITGAAKGHLLGNAAGTLATGAVTTADANVLLYNITSTNWSGIGTDINGNMWFRTGLAGTPAPAFYLTTAQVAGFLNSPVAPTPTAGDNSTKLATTAFVAGTVRTVKVQKFTASGTYTPSAGMLYCIVECWGAGGAGGGSSGTVSKTLVGAGGGGGGYSRLYLSAGTVGASKAVAIGAAGAVGAAGAAGGAGGATTFGTTIVVANGGNGGAGSAFSQGATGGGAAGTGDVAAPGPQALSIGGDVGASMTIGVGGTGATSALGGGGSGGLTNGSSLNGGAATGFAAGGGGGSSNNTATTSVGGAGAPGICVITEFCSQ